MREVSVGQVGVDSKVSQNHSAGPYEVISGHYIPLPPPIHMKI